MGLRYVGFVGARPSSGAVITVQERREGCFCSHAWLETSVERFIPARRLFLSLLRRSGYLSSVAAWYLGIGADLPYALATVLIPIQHEYMSARRWPVITFGLILINFGIFLSTHWVMDKQQSQLWQVRAHTLILAAMHPQLTLPPEVQEWVADFRNHEPAEWSRMQAPNYDLINEWDTRTSRLDDSAALQSEMDSLAGQYSQLMAISVDQRYGFVPAHPGPIAYLTSTFLHGGWWHLMGNMWFLWLAGFVLEDAWGRTLYLLVYLTAGAFACQFDAWANPGSIIPSVGASGAIAGLMGAFLVRFPKMKIRMMWFFDLGLFPFSRFWMRAYWLLPIWVLMEINHGMGRGTALDIGRTSVVSSLVASRLWRSATRGWNTR